MARTLDKTDVVWHIPYKGGYKAVCFTSRTDKGQTTYLAMNEKKSMSFATADDTTINPPRICEAAKKWPTKSRELLLTLLKNYRIGRQFDHHTA